MFYTVISLAFQTLLKTDLLRNPSRRCSFIVDLKVKKSLSHKLKDAKSKQNIETNIRY